MKKIELVAFIGLVGMPDEWQEADGKDDPLREVDWDEEARRKLAELEEKLPQMKGSDLDFLETEARKCLNKPRSENFPYLYRHQQMYLPHVLGLLQKEILRRAAVLNPVMVSKKDERRTPRTGKRSAAAVRRGKGTVWYNSSPDVLKRRQMVLKNPHFTARNFCNLFDGMDLRLPEGWREDFDVSKWTIAYNKPKLRARIQRIISTDRKKT